MAYRYDKNPITGASEIVIDGFEQGIANSAYEGIADIRNANIISSPKQASVAFATVGVTLPPTGYTAVAWSSDTATDIFTTTTTAGFYTGMAFTLVSTSGAGSGTAGYVYYVGNITTTTFKLYLDISLNTLLDVTVNRTGTFTITTFGTPTDSISVPGYAFSSETGLSFDFTFVMTSNGYVWFLTPIINPSATGGSIPQNTLQFLGNLGHSVVGTGIQTGLVVWKGYLFAFMGSVIDYISVTNIQGNSPPSTTWVYNWQTTTSSPQGHRAIPATDDAIYFCNGAKVGSILLNANQTFNPATPATYTYNTSALGLPTFDVATCLAQLGSSLLVGGILNYIYPWDRVATSFNYPLICAENYTKCIVAMNSSAYIFAGNRGRIYITNGANIDLFRKFPDYLSGTVDPYYNWGWAIYWKNKLYFTIDCTANTFSTVISNFAGVWALDIASKTLILSNSLSYGTYAGSVPTLTNMGHTIPTGDGIYAFWSNTTGGIDYTGASPYTNFETRIDTDIIPVGSFLTHATFGNIEYKLGKALVAGESVRLSYRTNLTDAFTTIFTSTALQLSDYSLMNFEGVQWLQIRYEASSTASSPSYVLLKEIRLR
jgi:hypothetical protein